MEAEIVLCKFCNTEYELLYDEFENCVSQTNCKCVRKDKIKKLDQAFKKIEEYLNEKSFSKNQRHSKKS
jgi:hypothetical protein